jgi:hypothetical protein
MKSSPRSVAWEWFVHFLLVVFELLRIPRIKALPADHAGEDVLLVLFITGNRTFEYRIILLRLFLSWQWTLPVLKYVDISMIA